MNDGFYSGFRAYESVKISQNRKKPADWWIQHLGGTIGFDHGNLNMEYSMKGNPITLLYQPDGFKPESVTNLNLKQTFGNTGFSCGLNFEYSTEPFERQSVNSNQSNHTIPKKQKLNTTKRPIDFNNPDLNNPPTMPASYTQYDKTFSIGSKFSYTWQKRYRNAPTYEISASGEYCRVEKEYSYFDQGHKFINNIKSNPQNKFYLGLGFKFKPYGKPHNSNRYSFNPDCFINFSKDVLNPDGETLLELGISNQFTVIDNRNRRRYRRNTNQYNKIELPTEGNFGVKTGYKTTTVQSEFNDNRVNNAVVSITGEASYHGFNVGGEYNIAQPIISSPKPFSVLRESVDAQDGKLYVGYRLRTGPLDMNFKGFSEWGGDAGQFKEEKNGVNVTLAENQTRHKFHKLGGEVGANFTLFEKNNTKIKATLDGGYNKVNLESVHIDENKNEIKTNNKYSEVPIYAGLECQINNKLTAYANVGGDALNGFNGISGQFGVQFDIINNNKRK